MGLKMKSSWNTKTIQSICVEICRTWQQDWGIENCKNKPRNSFVDAACNTKNAISRDVQRHDSPRLIFLASFLVRTPCFYNSRPAHAFTCPKLDCFYGSGGTTTPSPKKTLFGGIFQLQEVCSQSIAHFEDDPFEDEVCEGRPLELWAEMDQVWLKVAADVPRKRQVFCRFCCLKTLWGSTVFV